MTVQPMELQQAKERVVAAGRRLIEAGLIVRTWGNVSARISDDQFVITPSGKAYELLTPDDIVTVNIADGSYSGDVKPSSEKGIHAAVYRQRPDIHFVIHTHQVLASAVSTLRTDVTDIAPDLAALVGRRVLCAAFALPTTNKLAQNVATVLERSDHDAKAFLLASHGALCLGENDEEAFAVALALESVCETFLIKRYFAVTDRHRGDRPGAPAAPSAQQSTANRTDGAGDQAEEGSAWDEVRAHFVTFNSRRRAPGGRPDTSGSGAVRQSVRAHDGHLSKRRLYNSERCGDHFKLYVHATDDDPFPKGEQHYVKVPIGPPAAGADRQFGPDVPPEAEIHRRIYEQRPQIHAIIHTTRPDIVAVSQTGSDVRPLLDDFAQMVGTSAKSVPSGSLTAMAVTAPRQLRGRYAVMLEGHGALCCAPSKSDAVAVAYVLEKNCKALIGSHLFGGAQPIPFIEALLMRFVFVASYSKRAGDRRDGETAW